MITTLGMFSYLVAGKDTSAAYLGEKYGFKHISLSDMLRAEAKRQGLTTDREQLRLVANKLKGEQGDGVLAELAKKELSDRTIITAIRHPKEVEVLRTIPGFLLVEIFAPIDVRYNRAVLRGRDAGDKLTFEEFKASEERENSGGQMLNAVAKLVDRRIDNSGTFEQLYTQLNELVA